MNMRLDWLQNPMEIWDAMDASSLLGLFYKVANFKVKTWAIQLLCEGKTDEILQLKCKAGEQLFVRDFI